MQVGQKQIAEKLGVSIALVSRVLSGKAKEIGISPETIDRVLKAAETMGYTPSAAALAMKGKATRTIGVVVYDFKDPFFGATIEQLQIQAHEHNYSLVLTGFINRTPRDEDLQPLYKHAIDGLIVIGTDLNARWLAGFSHLPVARIGHGGRHEPGTQISIDERASALLLIEHLIKTGRTNPVYICADIPAHLLRRDIFKETAVLKNRMITTELSLKQTAFAAGAEAAERVIKSGQKADALICATDQVAIGALNTLHRKGIAVPGQIAVTGFDGIASGQQFIPCLTTIQQPLNEITALAFQSVTGQTLPSQQSLPGQLLIGEST